MKAILRLLGVTGLSAFLIGCAGATPAPSPVPSPVPPTAAPITWSAQEGAPVAVTITGGPWILTQLAQGNPYPPAVPNKSYGYDADCMTANSGKTSLMQPYYFPMTLGDGNILQGLLRLAPERYQ